MSFFKNEKGNPEKISALNFLETEKVSKPGLQQRWSRGHKAQGQGHKQNPRPRTALPRTDPLEAKNQQQRCKCFPKKKKGLQTLFSGNLQKRKTAKVFANFPRGIWGFPT